MALNGRTVNNGEKRIVNNNAKQTLGLILTCIIVLQWVRIFCFQFSSSSGKGKGFYIIQLGQTGGGTLKQSLFKGNFCPMFKT